MKKSTLYSLVFLLLLGFATTLQAQVKGKIQNPILPGFNPDPCIVRTGDDYYIVTSSFEWFPGIPIYHSKDLVNWKQIGHVLTRQSQLNMRGTADSDGIFAASITYHKGLYYVMFTNVQDGVNWSLKGYPNYIVTARDPKGPWSEPVMVDALGFDPSLFIDEDDKAYVLYRYFDHRPGKVGSPGIGMYALDLQTLKPIGTPKFIYSGWKKSSAEGPKMLKKDGYYYLFTAEGGTGYGHYQAVARAKDIWAAYERGPKLLYSAEQDSLSPIQKTGHGTLFTSPDGEWYTTHLGSRPTGTLGANPLGRETFIQKIEWTKDGWPQLAGGGITPQLLLDAPASNSLKIPTSNVFRDEFEREELDYRYQFLREPATNEWLSLSKVKGRLSLKGRRALGSRYDQSLLAQRVTNFDQQFETVVNFQPTDFRHSAGLTCYYDTKSFYALGFSFEEGRGLMLNLVGVDRKYAVLASCDLPAATKKVFMRLKVQQDKLQFSYSLDGKEWQSIGEALDFNKISDDYNNGYTGAMVGLFAQDMQFVDKWAHFDYFEVVNN